MKQLICAVLSMLLLGGCMGNVRLNERGIVQAIGVDLLETGSYRVTLQVSEAEASQNGGRGEETFLEIEKDGKTLTDALSAASLSQGKQMFLGSCKLILLGEGLAYNGCGPALNYFNDSHEINPSATLLLARGSAGELLKAREQDPLLNADTVLDIANDAVKSGLAPKSRLIDLVRAANSDYAVSALAAITLEKEGEASLPPAEQQEKDSGAAQQPSKEQKQAEKTSFEISGAGLFYRDRLTGYLDERTVRGLAWTQKELEAAPLVVEDTQLGRVAAVTSSHKAGLSVEMLGDNPVVNIEIMLSSIATESSLPSGARLSEQERAYTAALQELEIEMEVERMLDATQRQGLDILQTALLMQQREPDFYDIYAGNWGKAAASFGYNVDVTCEVLSAA